MNQPARITFREVFWMIFLVAVFALISLAASLMLGGCTAFAPPAGTSTTQPTPQSVNVYYLDRGGYITAVQAGVIGRLSGKVSDKSAREFELWRTVYVSGVLKPAELAAEPFVNANEWTRLITEQMAVEAQWAAVVPAPRAPPMSSGG